jgi:hypothetical protein
VFPIFGAQTAEEAFDMWMSAKESWEVEVQSQQESKIITPGNGSLPLGTLDENGLLMNRKQRRAGGGK